MGWVRVDDAFYDHRKFNKVTVLGMGVWIAGLAYCNRNLTDGFIPNKAIPGLVSTDGLGLYTGTHGGRDLTPADGAWELLRAQLWSEVDGGWQIHDYHDYQPSAQQVRADRDRNAERKAAWRAKASPTGSPSGTDNVTPISVPPPPNPNPKRTTKTSPSADADDVFDQFWQAYPVKKGKPDARKAWDKAIQRTDPALIIAGAERYRDDPTRNPEHSKWAQGWLNGARWTDPTSAAVDQSVPEAWR